MAKRDYYEILGVKKGADDKTIKSAYRKLAKKYHPDTNPGDQTSEQLFKEVTEAYNVLSDPEKRKLYDRFGHAAFDGSMGSDPYAYEKAMRQQRSRGFGDGYTQYQYSGDGKDMDDFLKNFFGSFGEGQGFFRKQGTAAGQGAARKKRTPSTRSDMTVTFREAALGCDKLLQMDRGIGGSETLSVHIPAGIGEGQSVRLRGKGQPKGDGTFADLLLRIHVQNDPLYTRKGNDVYLNQTVPFATAALGGEVQFDTLYGAVWCRIPEGSQSGMKIRLRNKGIVSMKEPNKYGDEYVTLQVQVPKNLTERERELIRELQSIEQCKYGSRQSA